MGRSNHCDGILVGRKKSGWSNGNCVASDVLSGRHATFDHARRSRRVGSQGRIKGDALSTTNI